MMEKKWKESIVMNSHLLDKAIQYDKGDPRRIQHFLKVHEFAVLIGTCEEMPQDQLDILEAAAILHDIGIHAAEEKYGSAAGKFQELEGPAPARHILQEMGYDDAFIDRVCFLIAHHHTYDQVDGLDYQILLEADFLVNAYEESLSPDAIATVRDKLFKTASGRRLVDTIYQST
jgi:HD superfamily phosphodiesterase